MTQANNDGKKGCIIYVADKSRLEDMEGEEFKKFVMANLGKQSNDDKECVIYVGDKKEVDKAKVDESSSERNLSGEDVSIDKELFEVDQEKDEKPQQEKESPPGRSKADPRLRNALSRQASGRGLAKMRSERMLQVSKEEFAADNDEAPLTPRRKRTSNPHSRSPSSKSNTAERTQQRVRRNSMGRDQESSLDRRSDHNIQRGVARTKSYESGRPSLARAGSSRGLRPVPQRSSSSRRMMRADDNDEDDGRRPPLSRSESLVSRPGLSRANSMRAMRPIPHRADSGRRFNDDEDNDYEQEGNASFGSVGSNRSRGSQRSRGSRASRSGHAGDLQARDRRALVAVIQHQNDDDDDDDDDDDSSLGSFDDIAEGLLTGLAQQGSQQTKESVSNNNESCSSIGNPGVKKARQSIFGSIFAMKGLKTQKDKKKDEEEDKQEKEDKDDSEDKSDDDEAEKEKTRRRSDSDAGARRAPHQRHSSGHRQTPERSGSFHSGDGEERRRTRQHRPLPVADQHRSPRRTNAPPRRLASDPMKQRSTGKSSPPKSSSRSRPSNLRRTGSSSSNPPTLVRSDSENSASS